MNSNYHRPGNPGPLAQTANQASPSLAKPEDFEIYDDYSGKPESVGGQTEDDPEAKKKSNTRFNIGSHYKRITDVNDVGENLP